MREIDRGTLRGREAQSNTTQRDRERGERREREIVFKGRSQKQKRREKDDEKKGGIKPSQISPVINTIKCVQKVFRNPIRKRTAKCPNLHPQYPRSEKMK